MEEAVRAASRTLILVSGGSRAGDAAMLEKAHESMRLVAHLRDILAEYPSD